LPADRRYRSTAIPGLEIEVLKAHEWTAERKVRVYYRGEEVRGAAEEAQMRQAAEQARQAAEQQVEQERQARLMTEQRAEQERYAVQQEVERLRALLREAGMEP
jgi:membrane protein involved in colicin uptake